MNCKPGDLAVIVRAEGVGFELKVGQAIVGRIVEVAEFEMPTNKKCCDTYAVWHFKEPLNITVDGYRIVVTGIADRCLRPIRDPGDDAQGETLNWLPVPVRDEVPA